MLNTKINIDDIKVFFSSIPSFSSSDLHNYFNSFENEISASTLNWRIHYLVSKGVIKRIGHGRFTISKTDHYFPVSQKIIDSLYKKIKREFPSLSLCIWSSSVLEEFFINKSEFPFVIIETRKDSLDIIFNFLRNNKMKAYLDPDKEMMTRYILTEKNVIILIPLITEAPVQKFNGIDTITIEKLLVDVFYNKSIFYYLSDQDSKNIFVNAINKYTINENRMLKYADRRHKKNYLIKF